MRREEAIHKVIERPTIPISWLVQKLDVRRRGRRALSRPLTFQIETTNLCNLDCDKCLRQRQDRAVGYMEPSDMEEILSNIPAPLFITLQGWGEPLMNPYLYDIIDLLYDRNVLSNFATNCIKLSSDKEIEKLIESDVDAVGFSYDNTFYCAGRSKRKKILGNIKIVMNSDITSSFGMTLTPRTVRDMEEILTELDEIGVEEVSFGSRFSPEMSFREYLGHAKDELENRRRELSEKYNMEIEMELSEKTCTQPWVSPSISWDGYVFPCCFTMDMEFSMGNVLDENLMSIWNSEKFMDFREMVRDHPKGRCRHCQNRWK